MKRTINYLAICLAAITVLLPATLSAYEIRIEKDNTLAIVMPKDSTGVFYIKDRITIDTLRIDKISRNNGTKKEKLTVKSDATTFDLGLNQNYADSTIIVRDSCGIKWGNINTFFKIIHETEKVAATDSLQQDPDTTNSAGEYLLLLVKSSNSTENINKEDVVCSISMSWVIFSGILLLAIIIAILIISYMVVKKKESAIRAQEQLLKEITEYPKSENDNSDDNILKRLKEYISELESKIESQGSTPPNETESETTDGNFSDMVDDNILERLKEYISALKGIESKIETLDGFQSEITRCLSSDCGVEIKDDTTECIIEQLRRHISAQKDNKGTVTLDELKSRIKDMCNNNLNISDKNNLDEILNELKSCLDTQKHQSIATQIDKETRDILDRLKIIWKDVAYAELIKVLVTKYKEIEELINNEDSNKVFKDELESIKKSQREIGRILKDKTPKNVEELCEIFVKYLPDYFSYAVEQPNDSQRLKLVAYLKNFLKEMSGKNFENLTIDLILKQYKLLSDKELNEKCLEKIKEKTGKEYGTYEALKADIEKPSADAPVKTDEDVEKLNEYGKLSQYGENAERIIKWLKEIGVKDLLGCDSATAKKNLNVFETLSQQTKKDTADDIRAEIIENAVNDIKIDIDKIDIDDKTKDLVKKTDIKLQISSINSGKEPRAMSTALNTLVKMFAKELGTLQGDVDEANRKESELLDKIKSDYKRLFNNEELTAQKPTPAFNSFVTKVNNVTADLNGRIKEADRKESELLGKIKSDYKTLFDNGKEITAEKSEDAFNSFVEKANDLKEKNSGLVEDLNKEKDDRKKDVQRLEDESKLKTQEIKTMCQEWISQISKTFDEINTAINTTCRIPSNDISNRFRRFVIENDGYKVEEFKKAIDNILDNKDMLFADYQKIKSGIKALIREALGRNSWIHALTRMYLYIQQPKVAERFIEAGVVTSSIERAFIITEQMLRDYGVLLEYPNLFIDEFDNDKYENRPLADINNIIGHSLVRELVNDRTSVLIDLHRVGYTIDDTTSKPLVSKFS